MYCKNCGKEIDESVRFCPACGKKNLPEIKSKKINRKKIIFSVISVISLSVIILCAIWFSGYAERVKAYGALEQKYISKFANVYRDSLNFYDELDPEKIESEQNVIDENIAKLEKAKKDINKDIKGCGLEDAWKKNNGFLCDWNSASENCIDSLKEMQKKKLEFAEELKNRRGELEYYKESNPQTEMEKAGKQLNIETMEILIAGLMYTHETDCIYSKAEAENFNYNIGGWAVKREESYIKWYVLGISVSALAFLFSVGAVTGINEKMYRKIK